MLDTPGRLRPSVLAKRRSQDSVKRNTITDKVGHMGHMYLSLPHTAQVD